MATRNCNEFTLITGRTRFQAISMESSGKFDKEYEKSVAVAYMNPTDIDGLKLNHIVRITSNDRSIILPVKEDPSLPNRVIFIPIGPWSNFLISSKSIIGMPNYKSVKVCVERVNRDEPLPRLEDLFADIGRPFITFTGRDLVQQHEICNNDVKLATCIFCGAVCSNIIVKVCGNTVLEVLDGCSISVSKFINRHRNRVLRPLIMTPNSFEFKEVPLPIAIDKAADILLNSKHPLIYGLSSTSNEAIEIAIEIAKILKGAIDSTASICHGPTLLGLDGATIKSFKLDMLSDIDTVIIWGANPAEAHPKLMYIIKRYVKSIAVVDVRESETMKMADIGLIIEPGKDLELIRAIRSMIKGYRGGMESVNIGTDIIERFIKTLLNSRKGVIFTGLGLSMGRAKFMNIVELVELVKELNNYGEWYLQPLRGHFNVTGTNILLKKFTGYPFAVDFYSDSPIMAPGVTTAIDLLKNREVDSVVVIASDPVAHMPNECVRILAELSLIVIDSRWSLTASLADVVIPTCLTGIECRGSIYRMDYEIIEVDKIVEPPESVLCDTDVLRMLLDRIKKGLSYD
ncbi:MAG: formylmethanofuran dehydrogenase subunit B [Ignisphaera sp.]|uniref:Formylmethanofuran dehydrogenase subunit B n=1 Tax=Ignisphaera aggregans TaxID=334771 RepID=A0A7J3MWQ5_9CREN